MRNVNALMAQSLAPFAPKEGPKVRPNHEMSLFELHQLTKHIRESYLLQKKSRDQMLEAVRTADKNVAELFVTLSNLETDLRDLMIKHDMTDFSELITVEKEDA